MEELPEQHKQGADLVAVVLAAGMGTRMRSGLHKILHPIAGDLIISHVLSAISAASISEVVLVVGNRSEQVVSAVGEGVRYAVQEPQLGTGHALQQALAVLDPVPRQVVVLCGDTPLLTSSTISRMIAELGDASIVLLSSHLLDPTGYGRVVRGNGSAVRAIVEDADADSEIRAIDEINGGLYCFDGEWLVANLPKLKKSAKGEYYLTDLVAEAVAQGREVRAVVAEDATEVMGVNDRAQLADADRVMRDRICRELMAKGVTISDPATTYIGKDVTVGVDSVIHPGTHLRGNTVVGERCEIGPNSIVENSTIGDDSRVIASMLEQCRVADRVSIGPFSHLRPGAVIASNARIGNYAEVKNSTVGEGVQMHHFSYLGDAEIGEGTNVGAGTITCNFNLKGEKHRTRVGKRVFLGSDTMLRAPVEIGDDAATGAGSVVTRDVPPGAVVFGVPARQKEGPEKHVTAGPELNRQGEMESGG